MTDEPGGKSPASKINQAKLGMRVMKRKRCTINKKINRTELEIQVIKRKAKKNKYYL